MTRDYRTRIAQCTRKAAYKTLTAARQEAARLERTSGEKLTAYACPWCRRYHVGHKP